AEQALDIGMELARRFTKDKYQYIVATHTDHAHIHNHIIFNSTVIDGTKKFRNFYGSSQAIRKLSDLICIENSLSVITNPSGKHQDYGKWLGNKKPETYRDKLRKTISDIMAKKPTNFDQFLQMMTDAGYEIKRGEHIAFRAKDQQKYTRLRSLGDGYSEKEIRAAIQGKAVFVPKKQNRSKIDSKKISLLVDIQAKLQAGKGAGYERWAKIFNLKQMAKTIAFLEENKIENYEELVKMSQAAAAEFQQISKQIKNIEEQIYEANISRQNQILENEASLSSLKNSVNTNTHTSNQISELLQTKKQLLTKYRQHKNTMRDLQTVLANTKAIIEDISHDKSGKSVCR
ncbi:MAG: relaxase/mobilization nuclease domain-containing protein, partial [Massilibacteroides sp.]|nr:relaxase/mobilization nuclease domain-containing protein [Massilibacteroides sp.]